MDKIKTRQLLISFSHLIFDTVYTMEDMLNPAAYKVRSTYCLSLIRSF